MAVYRLTEDSLTKLKQATKDNKNKKPSDPTPPEEEGNVDFLKGKQVKIGTGEKNLFKKEKTITPTPIQKDDVLFVPIGLVLEETDVDKIYTKLQTLPFQDEEPKGNLFEKIKLPEGFKTEVSFRPSKLSKPIIFKDYSKVIFIDQNNLITFDAESQAGNIQEKKFKLQGEDLIEVDVFDELIDPEKETVTTKFNKEDLSVGDKVYIYKDKKKQDDLVLEENATKEIKETYKKSYYEIVKLGWNDKRNFYEKVELKALGESQPEERIWADRQANKYEIIGTESSIVEQYWRDKVLTKKEQRILDGKADSIFFKASALTKAKLEAKELQKEYLPSYRLFHKRKWDKTFKTHEDQLIIAILVDDNLKSIKEEYVDYLMDASVTYASNIEFGAKCIIYVINELSKKLNLDSKEIVEIFEAFTDNDKLQEDHILLAILNNASYLKEEYKNEALSKDRLLDIDQAELDRLKAEEEQENDENGKMILARYIYMVTGGGTKNIKSHSSNPRADTIKTFKDNLIENPAAGAEALKTYLNMKGFNIDDMFDMDDKGPSDRKGLTKKQRQEAKDQLLQKLKFSNKELQRLALESVTKGKRGKIEYDEEDFIIGLKQYFGMGELDKGTINKEVETDGKYWLTFQICLMDKDIVVDLTRSSKENKNFNINNYDKIKEFVIKFEGNEEVANEALQKYIKNILKVETTANIIFKDNELLKIAAEHKENRVKFIEAFKEFINKKQKDIKSKELQEGELQAAFYIFNKVSPQELKNNGIESIEKNASQLQAYMQQEDLYGSLQTYLKQSNLMEEQAIILNALKNKKTSDEEVKKNICIAAKNTNNNEDEFINNLKTYATDLNNGNVSEENKETSESTRLIEFIKEICYPDDSLGVAAAKIKNNTKSFVDYLKKINLINEAIEIESSKLSIDNNELQELAESSENQDEFQKNLKWWIDETKKETSEEEISETELTNDTNNDNSEEVSSTDDLKTESLQEDLDQMEADSIGDNLYTEVSLFWGLK